MVWRTRDQIEGSVGTLCKEVTNCGNGDWGLDGGRDFFTQDCGRFVPAVEEYS